VGAVLREQTAPSVQRLVRQFEQILPRVEQVIDQTVRHIVHGEMMPAQDKLVSLFEPHTYISVRPKMGRPVEFCRKVWLEEGKGGILSGDWILAEAG
jgi:IS5 family transposase